MIERRGFLASIAAGCALPWLRVKEPPYEVSGTITNLPEDRFEIFHEHKYRLILDPRWVGGWIVVFANDDILRHEEITSDVFEGTTIHDQILIRMRKLDLICVEYDVSLLRSMTEVTIGAVEERIYAYKG